MDTLPPIPTPPAQRWREFRIQVLPLIVFGFILVAVVVVWRNFIQPVGVVGEVEAIRANVTSLQEGLLAELTVDLFEQVTNGQVIGRIIPTDAESLAAQTAAIVADVMILGERMKIDERRREQDLQGLTMQRRQEEVALAIDQANLFAKSNAMIRAYNLVQDKTGGIVPLADYDIAKAEFDALQAGISKRAAMLDVWTKELENLQTTKTPSAQKDPIDEAIKAKTAELEALTKASSLRAPRDGVISIIYRRAGEKVVVGEPIVTVSALEAHRIVGYMRQPIGTFPSTNDTVLVRTRSQPPRVAPAKVLQVGGQIQPIPAGLLSVDPNHLESGLPILVSLPDTLKVVPGEFVDLSIRAPKR